MAEILGLEKFRFQISKYKEPDFAISLLTIPNFGEPNQTKKFNLKIGFKKCEITSLMPKPWRALRRISLFNFQRERRCAVIQYIINNKTQHNCIYKK